MFGAALGAGRRSTRRGAADTPLERAGRHTRSSAGGGRCALVCCAAGGYGGKHSGNSVGGLI
jgi:hypothetical protein